MLELHSLIMASSNVRAQQAYGWHMHNGGYMHDGYWGIGGAVHALIWLLIFAVVVAAAIVLARSLWRKDRGDEGATGSSALDQLDERYARGEIDREEYLQRKKDILDR
jgi:putative membrane protein